MFRSRRAAVLQRQSQLCSIVGDRVAVLFRLGLVELNAEIYVAVHVLQIVGIGVALLVRLASYTGSCRSYGCYCGSCRSGCRSARAAVVLEAFVEVDRLGQLTAVAVEAALQRVEAVRTLASLDVEIRGMLQLKRVAEAAENGIEVVQI